MYRVNSTTPSRFTYTQDRTVLLSQVRSDGTAYHISGREHLRTLHGSWFLSDARSRMRQPRDAASVVFLTKEIELWGTCTVR